MAKVIWADPAIQDLDAIADYIALDKPEAAHRLVRRVLAAVERLQRFPHMGSACRGSSGAESLGLSGQRLSLRDLRFSRC